MHKQFHSKVSRFGAVAFSFNNPNTNYRYSGLLFLCWIQAIFYCLGYVICGANERWLLIYKKKLSDKSKRWIIYSTGAEKTPAFHTVFHAKCHMNSKWTKEFVRLRLNSLAEMKRGGRRSLSIVVIVVYSRKEVMIQLFFFSILT